MSSPNTGSINLGAFRDAIIAKTTTVNEKLAALQGAGENISIAAMFEMQLAMNLLSQTTEYATSTTQAMQQSAMSIARGVKG
jgi:hypothetical protein